MLQFGTRALTGRRVLITGAARGIGAALARRLHERGARVAMAGLEPDALAVVAAECDNAPWRLCDVAEHEATEKAVAELVGELGGLDIVVANAGIAKQWPVVGGDPDVLEQMMRVNVLGCYHTLRAAVPHISHGHGYALAMASLAAAVHPPLLGAYSASKAAVEALGNTLRVELRPHGIKVGVGYFAELDTDMTSRGFATEAAGKLALAKIFTKVTPLPNAIDAIEGGIARRYRRIVAPWWVSLALPARMTIQRILELGTQRGLSDALRVARQEDVAFTTPQLDRDRPDSRGATQ